MAMVGPPTYPAPMQQIFLPATSTFSHVQAPAATVWAAMAIVKGSGGVNSFRLGSKREERERCGVVGSRKVHWVRHWHCRCLLPIGQRDANGGGRSLGCWLVLAGAGVRHAHRRASRRWKGRTGLEHVYLSAWAVWGVSCDVSTLKPSPTLAQRSASRASSSFTYLLSLRATVNLAESVFVGDRDTICVGVVRGAVAGTGT